MAAVSPVSTRTILDRITVITPILDSQIRTYSLKIRLFDNSSRSSEDKSSELYQKHLTKLNQLLSLKNQINLLSRNITRIEASSPHERTSSPAFSELREITDGLLAVAPTI